MPTVLLVDDEAATVFGLKVLLEAEGVRVLDAGEKAAALALLDSHPVDVLLTDVQLTAARDTHGLDLLMHIRRRGLPVRSIVVTGYGAPGILQAAFDLGAAYYFEKPVSLEALSEALRDLGVSCTLNKGR